MKRYGALEAGGTKMVLSILDENGTMLERKSIPTRTPAETMPEMAAFFREHSVTALGIGCFGPLDLNLSVSSGGMAQSQLYALCALTGTISPMFFVGTLHAWGVAQKTCLCLLAAHGLGALLAFVCVRRLSPAKEKVAARETSEKANGNPIADSVFSVLGVGGCIVFFSVAAACIRVLFPFLPENGCAYLQSMLEIAGGMRMLIQTSGASFARDVSMAVLTGFGGLSILTQNHLFLQVCGVTQGRLLCLALLRALMSGAVMALLLWLI